MIDILVDEGVEAEALPSCALLRQTVQQTLQCAGFDNAEAAQLCLRFTTDARIRELNRHWRGQDCATDVLSFPLQTGPAFTLDEYLGDIALALPYVLHEAERLGLSPADHVRHLVVHGTLHLIGYDHAAAEDRRRMQTLEKQVMQALGLHDPFPLWATQENASCN